MRVDAAGRVDIVDRAKDMINRGGENVSSVEVEDVLADAPGVVEAAVVGVPDDVMGEKVGAVLVDSTADEASTSTRCSPTAAHTAGRLQECRSTDTSSTARCRATPAASCSRSRLRSDVSWGAALR